MEGFGHDVAQKIKSAIRAKLVELDAYVDDELPDYILVMVANKKSKTSMVEDLNLFLNEHTEQFTDWLHDVLNKLHSVTLESSKGRRRSSAETKKSLSGSATVNKEPIAESEAVTTSETTFAVAVETVAVADTQSAEVTETSSVEHHTTAPEAVPADADLQDEFLAIKAEQEKDDILGEELKEEATSVTAEIPAPLTAVQSKAHTKTQPLKTDVSTKISSSIDSSQQPVQKQSQPIFRPATAPSDLPRIIRTRKTTVDEPQETASTATMTTPPPLNGVAVPKSTTRNVADPVPALIASRKRKAPTSTLGAIVQRPFPRPDDEDDEYDPRHPIIGTVASVVQVTERRSSVPPEHQANKNLLFKALAEARKSVLSSTKPSQEIFVNNDSATQLFTRTYLSAIKFKGDDQSASSRESGKIKPRILLNPSSSTSSVLRSPRLSARQVKGEQLKRPANESMTTCKAVAAEAAKPVATTTTSSSPVSYEPMPLDQQDANNVTYVKNEVGAPEKLEELADYSAEEDQQDEVELEDKQEQEELMEGPTLQQISSPVRASSPKFIITLDGVDAEDMFPGYENSAMETSDDALDLVVEDELESEFQNQQQQQWQGNSNTGSNNSVDDETFVSDPDEMDASDNLVDAEEMENMSAKKPKLIQERCRYWPSCRNGDGCPYRHPSTPCKTFPNCKFGNRCIYIHPACKFDSVCSRRDCPYAHTGNLPADAPIVPSLPPRRRPLFAKVMVGCVPIKTFKRIPSTTSSTPLASKTRCRDFPKCNNMDCPFLHPKPCRYGVSCSRTNCIFSHPELPKPDQLKWNSRSQSSAIIGARPTKRTAGSERKIVAVKVEKHIATPVEIVF